MRKNNKYKKQYERDQLINKSSHNLYRKSLQDIKNVKNENESLCIIFTKYFDENINDTFL